MADTVVITGSGGLIGGETVRFFAEKGFYLCWYRQRYAQLFFW